MKKVYSILMILAAAAGLTNCSKADLVENKEAENGGTVVYATTDAVTTRTTLADDYNVLWSTGDQIKFVKDGATTTTYTFTLSEGVGTTSGTFSCAQTPEDGEYTVYYPDSYDGTNWPAQTYVSATDISGAPMKATSTVTDGKVSDLSFKNEGGILRYTVKGDKTIKSINVKSASPALDVTLDCGTSGVALTAEGTVFNIALPAGEYSNATLTFTATDNTVATLKASTFIVKKNMVSLATFNSGALSFAAPLPNGALSGVFSVSDNKTVYFSKGNLWYGPKTTGASSTFNFETNQYDISSSWNEYHVSNFYWSQTASSAYAEDYDESDSDVLFTNATETEPNTNFTVSGMTDFWRTLSQAEWKYLLEDRTMTNGKDRYSNAMKDGVTIGSKPYKGIFLYPDNYNGDIVSGLMTWEQINAAGIVFLPSTGYRSGTVIDEVSDTKISCIYWTSTVAPDDDDYYKMAYRMFFKWDKSENPELVTEFEKDGRREWAVGIRLVTDVPAS